MKAIIALIVLGGLSSSAFAQSSDSFIKRRKIVVGDSPRMEVLVRPATEPEYMGKGIQADEWYGMLEISVLTRGKRRKVYGEDLISGLDLSTASIVSDLLPSTRCLWIEYKDYGWSAPHHSATVGKLFLIENESLKPIWTLNLEERDGEGKKVISDYHFSHISSATAKDQIPSIHATESVWTENRDELGHPPKELKRSRSMEYVYDGKTFVLASSRSAH